jgi:hypothetical protein
MPSAVKLRTDFSAAELPRLAKRSKDNLATSGANSIHVDATSALPAGHGMFCLAGTDKRTK